jgi:hypothetical protein
MVLPPPRAFGTCNMFIDDGSCILLDEQENIKLAQVAVLQSVEVPTQQSYKETQWSRRRKPKSSADPRKSS